LFVVFILQLKYTINRCCYRLLKGFLRSKRTDNFSKDLGTANAVPERRRDIMNNYPAK